MSHKAADPFLRIGAEASFVRTYCPAPGEKTKPCPALGGVAEIGTLWNEVAFDPPPLVTRCQAGSGFAMPS